MKILAGIDLNTTGHEWLVERAARLASIIGGTVDLVFIIAENKQSQSDAALKQLEGMMQRVPTSARGDARVLPGSPVDTILEQTAHYDVMVVGPREPGAIERFFLGTFATRIIRKAKCPVLVARSEQLVADREPRLLVGIDLRRGDPTGVIDLAGRWSLRFGGRIDAVFAEKDPSLAIPDASMRAKAQKEWQASRESDRTAVAGLLAPLGDRVRGEALLGTGEPADCLVALSKLYDVVLVGNREAGIADLILGSVAQVVVRNAACDVLVLPTAEDE